MQQKELGNVTRVYAQDLVLGTEIFEQGHDSVRFVCLQVFMQNASGGMEAS